mgnify:CR=1 FL=1
MEKEHRKKIIAPVVIAAVSVLYYALFLGVLLWLPMFSLMKILLGVVPLVFIGVLVFVTVERIQEIRSGEEDDLSKY